MSPDYLAANLRRAVRDSAQQDLLAAPVLNNSKGSSPGAIPIREADQLYWSRRRRLGSRPLSSGPRNHGSTGTTTATSRCRDQRAPGAARDTWRPHIVIDIMAFGATILALGATAATSKEGAGHGACLAGRATARGAGPSCRQYKEGLRALWPCRSWCSFIQCGGPATRVGGAAVKGSSLLPPFEAEGRQPCPKAGLLYTQMQFQLLCPTLCHTRTHTRIHMPTLKHAHTCAQGLPGQQRAKHVPGTMGRLVEPTVARSDSLRGCWPVDVLCTTINVEAAAR